jgi:hypothetical protein
MSPKKKNLIRLTFITRIAAKLAVEGATHDAIFVSAWREFCGMLFVDEFIDASELGELLSERPLIAIVRDSKVKTKTTENDTKDLN